MECFKQNVNALLQLCAILLKFLTYSLHLILNSYDIWFFPMYIMFCICADGHVDIEVSVKHMEL